MMHRWVSHWFSIDKNHSLKNRLMKKETNICPVTAIWIWVYGCNVHGKVFQLEAWRVRERHIFSFGCSSATNSVYTKKTENNKRMNEELLHDSHYLCIWQASIKHVHARIFHFKVVSIHWNVPWTKKHVREWVKVYVWAAGRLVYLFRAHVTSY